MKISLIDMNEESRRVSVFYDAPIYLLFSERIFAFASFTIHKGIANNGCGIVFGTWYDQATKLPVDPRHSVELDKFARGWATAKGLIN